jgi:hypothetical protein
MNNKLIEKYQDYSIPPPGSGFCHGSILGKANLGIIAGVDPQTIFTDIRNSIQPGPRNVLDQEISDAIHKAQIDLSGKTDNKKFIPPKPSPKFDGITAREKLISKAHQELTEADLFDLSPIRMDWPREDDTVHFLYNMYHPDDLIFIGSKYDDGIIGTNIRSQRDWIQFFKGGGKAGPQICTNPLTGELAEKKTKNGLTYRGDNCIKSFRYCLVEFDTLSLSEQIRFWCEMDLPVKALVSSGGKSIHAWIDISKLKEIDTQELWDLHIRNRLYEMILIPLGVDRACDNPSRLSRLPGAIRPETNKYQSILWMSAEGLKVKR